VSDGSAVVLGGTVPRQRDGWMWDLTVPRNDDHDFCVQAAKAHRAVLTAKPGARGGLDIEIRFPPPALP
jgi:hypothetical protein